MFLDDAVFTRYGRDNNTDDLLAQRDFARPRPKYAPNGWPMNRIHGNILDRAVAIFHNSQENS
jgi:hypothetical protein